MNRLTKRNKKRYIPLVFWVMLPILVVGIVFSIIVIQYWCPTLLHEAKERVESDLKLASKLGMRVCDYKFDLILESHLEDDINALRALRKESLEEIKAISENFHKIYMLVVDGRGNAIASSFSSLARARFAVHFPRRLSQIESYILDGLSVKAHVRYFPLWDWYIVSFIKEEDFKAPLLFIKYTVYGGTFGIFAITLLTFILTYRHYISRPLMFLVEASHEISEGRFVTIPVSPKNELGLVIDAFNHMVNNLEQHRKELYSALKALRKNEQFLHAILESIQDGIVVFGDDLRVKYVNSVVKDWFGEKAFLVGKTCDEILSRYGGDIAECELIKSTLKTGIMRTAVVKGLYGSSVEWFEISTYPIKETLSGKVVGVVEVKKDITDARRVSDALRESEERYRTLVENSFDAIIMLSMKRKIISCNQAFLEMFGYARDEVIGKSIRLIHPSDESFYNLGKIHYPLLIQKGSQRLEWEFVRKDGTRIDTEIVSSLVRDSNGNNVGVVAIIRDITERKRYEERISQLQKMEAVGRLAGGIAHDFNNLLQVIIGYVQILLADKSHDDPDFDSLKIIEDSAYRGKELVQQILAFSRSTEARFEPVNLNEIVEHTVRMLERTMSKAINIKLCLSENVSPIKANSVQIEQIIINLAVNAQDAMPDGGEIVVSTTEKILDESEIERLSPEANPGRYVVLCISDTGKGIDKSIINRIFEPFFTTKDVGKGSGLGLAVVYGIVRSHGGFITCESEVGEGTTFTIYFPVSEQLISKDKMNNFSDVKLTLRRGKPKRRGTILLVDDEEMIRILGKEVLERVGYDVLLAKSGEEAVEIYKNVYRNVDLIILDLNMPGMGGIPCLKVLRDINPSANIVIASGYIDRENVKKAMSFGARTYLYKPFSMDHLLEIVDELLT